MARIDSYTAITPTVDDYLLGTDSPAGGGPTRNFTVQSIIDLTSASIGNTNDYLDGITVEAGYAADASDTATITFSVGSQSDIALNLGGAAFKAASYYATTTSLADHINDTTQPHSLDSIVGAGTITTTKLSGNPGAGTAGQVLLSNGAGGFSWGTDQDDNDNYYLSSVTRPNGSSSDVLFAITGGTNVTATIFGEGAFMSKAEIRTDIENNASFEASDFTFLGDLATKDLVDTVDIKQSSIDATKIKDNIITEDKLKIINDPVDGYVLTADGTNGNMEWVANSASNYYLNAISRGGTDNRTLTFDVLGVSSDPTYTFGDGAFALFAGSGDNFGSGDTVARGDHNHAIGDLTGAGALASKDTVDTNEIANKAVTAGKLSPAVAGVDGQVLSINSSGELIWLNASGTVIPDARILPATVGNTNADANDGLGSQVLRVNSAGTGVEYIDLSVEKNEINTGNNPSAGKILGIDANGDMQWVGSPSVDIGADSITAAKINFIDDNLSAATAGHILVSDGTDFGNVAMSGDANINGTGVLSLQPAAINSQSLLSSIGGTDSFLIYDVSTSSLKKTTYANISGSVYIGITGDIQIDSGGNATVNIGYDQLKNEFTDTKTQVLTAFNPLCDFGQDAIFDLTLPGSAANLSLNIASAKTGMTKVFIIRTNASTDYTGTLTFDVTDAAANPLTGTPTFVRLSSDDIVKTANTVNYMQITCIAEGQDAGDRTFIYTVGTAQ